MCTRLVWPGAQAVDCRHYESRLGFRSCASCSTPIIVKTRRVMWYQPGGHLNYA